MPERICSRATPIQRFAVIRLASASSFQGVIADVIRTLSIGLGHWGEPLSHARFINVRYRSHPLLPEREFRQHEASLTSVPTGGCRRVAELPGVIGAMLQSFLG